MALSYQNGFAATRSSDIADRSGAGEWVQHCIPRLCAEQQASTHQLFGESSGQTTAGLHWYVPHRRFPFRVGMEGSVVVPGLSEEPDVLEAL